MVGDIPLSRSAREDRLMAEPYTKADQLARGPKRPARVKAGREEWVRLRRAKLGTCRLRGVGNCEGRSQLHHLISRGRGGGDVASNLCPLCERHHRLVTLENGPTLAQLASRLTDDEYAHIITELGEGALERLFGVLGAGVRS